MKFKMLYIEIKKKVIIISVLALVACSPSMVCAWFSGAHAVNQPFHDQLSGISSDSTLLFVYDNVISGHDQAVAPYLMPSNRDFVPADKVNINMPLKVLSIRSGSIVDSLDALLNANLALRLLLEQYNALQDRASEILISLNIPYLEQLGEKSIENMNISFDGGELGAQLDAQESNIRLRSAELNHKISETVKNKPSGAFYVSEKRVPSFAGLKVEAELEMESGKKIFTVAESQYESIPGDVVASAGVSSVSGETPAEGGEYLEGGSRETDKVVVNTASGKRELPWIFMLVLNAVKYVATNKFEGLFYGTVLFFVSYIIWVKARE